MNYLIRHLQVLFGTCGRMCKAPLPTLMTLIMLGIAIALPLMLYKIVDSLAEVAAQWRERPRISLFLNLADANLNSQQIDEYAIEFARRLLQIPAIDDIEYISPSAALTEFKRVSGFGAALEHLPENPLPPLLVVYPHPTQEFAYLQQLFAQLSAMAEVDSASLDQAWVQRLTAILALFERGVLMLSLLMAVGVMLIIGNTVRLGVVNRSDEIEIIDQLGGTRAFIRRPFLYLGVLQGMFGALCAAVIGNLGLYLLGKPVATLAALYDSSFNLGGFGVVPIATVVLLAAVLGGLSARITVGWRLYRLIPVAV